MSNLEEHDLEQAAITRRSTKAPKRRTITIALTITVPAGMLMDAARCEVRTLINEQCNWSADPGDIRAVKVA